MSDTPQISVIIPVYNTGAFLREALDSVLAQNFREWEAICVDDGSTDDSLKILREYSEKDARFVVIAKDNSGYGATVNLGIARARGKYIAILEPDDFLADSDAYATLFSIAEKNAADVVKGDYRFYWSDGRSRPANALRACPRDMVINARECGELLLIQPSVWSALYRADFLREASLSFLETPGASFQDISFSFKVFAAADRVVLNETVIINYRQDNANASMKSRNKVFCVADELREVERWLDEHPELKTRFAYEKWMVHYNAFSANLPRLTWALQDEFLQAFRKEFLKASACGELPSSFVEDARIQKRFPLLLKYPRRYLFIMRRRFILHKLRENAKNCLKILLKGEKRR